MKARVLTATQQHAVRVAAKFAAEQQIEDAVKRAQAIWCVAALNSGLKPRTVERVLKQIPFVLDGFQEYKMQRDADFVLFKTLRDVGIDMGMPMNTEL